MTDATTAETAEATVETTGAIAADRRANTIWLEVEPVTRFHVIRFLG